MDACASANFYAKGVYFDHIYGQAKGYQKGGIDAFYFKQETVNDRFGDVVSITIGSPSKPVWTYAVSLSDDHNYPNWNCPYATVHGPSPPAFVGNNYYCESEDMGIFNRSSYYLPYSGLILRGF